MNPQPELVELFSQARQIAVLTGAGASAESGIPTFRDAQTGLWARYQPEELATREAFAANPQRVWEWYAFRRHLIADARPNPGHYALASLEQSTPFFTLITQNIDGLHQAAGSHHVLELHGSIWRARCFDCATLHTGSLDVPAPPICPQCRGLMRPDVVWFGEKLPGEIFQAAMDATRECDLFVIIGTSGLVHPAASLPMIAFERSIPCVEINPESTPFTAWATHSLRGKAGEILPALVQSLHIKEKSE